MNVTVLFAKIPKLVSRAVITHHMTRSILQYGTDDDSYTNTDNLRLHHSSLRIVGKIDSVFVYFCMYHIVCIIC